MGFSTRMYRGVLACGLLALAFIGVSSAHSETAVPSASDIEARVSRLFANADKRLPGSEGNRVIEDRVATIFKESSFTNGDLKFVAPVFKAGPATIGWGGQSPVVMHAMHPTLVRPGNFAETDFESRVVYLGKGTQQDLQRLDGVDLKDCIGLMDFDCGPDWMRFLRFGIKGFLFIGADSYTRFDAVSKVHDTEVSIPRYFLEKESGLALKAAVEAATEPLMVSIHAEPSRWENQELRDLWVIVPGADPKLSKEVVMLVAPLDSNGIVPEQSESALSAVNLDLLLALLEQYTKDRPARTVVLAAVNAHTQRCLGERILAWFALAPAERVEGLRNDMASDARLQELYARTYGPLKLDGTQDEADRAYLRVVRTNTDDTIKMALPLKEPLQNRSKSDVSRLKEEKITLGDKKKLSDEELLAARKVLDEKLANHTGVLTLFNKFRPNDPSNLVPEQVAMLRRYVEGIVTEKTSWAALNRKDLARDMANGAIAAELSGKRVVLVFCLSFNWGSERIGLSSDNYWGVGRWAYDFGRHIMDKVAKSPVLIDGGRTNRIVDTLTNLGGLPEGHFFPPDEPGMSACPQLAVFMSSRSPGAGMPTFGLENVNADYGLAFTPSDTFEALNYERIALVYDVVPHFLKLIMDDPDAVLPSNIKDLSRPGTGMYSTRVQTFLFDEFSADLTPTIPIPGAIITAKEVEYTEKVSIPPITGGDVINAYFALSDERCVAYLYGIRNDSTEEKFPLYSTIYHLTNDWRSVDFFIDAGEAHTRVSSFIKNNASQYVALFPCTEMVLYDLNDPSMVGSDPIRSAEIILYDAKREASPKSFGYTGFQSPLSSRNSKDFPVPSGPGAVYMEEDISMKLLKGGDVGTKRVALNSSAEHPNGVGYSKEAPVPPAFFSAAAIDMAFLNTEKVRKLSGVTDALISGFQLEGSNALAEAEHAREQNRHLAYLGAIYRALGAEVKAYEQAMGMANDMLKAVVFYMILMLPFCFFLQRLLFKTVRIEAQMGIFAILFVCVYVVFRLIHPAFKIAQAPEAMFIAFIMGALGFFVIHILHGRFEGEMQLLFRTLVASDVAEVGAGTVGGQAMLIGVNNMKRRRIRTALTTGTIILVTFTMLAFTSVSKKLSPTVISESKFAPYTGIMYHWPSGVMDEPTLEVIRDLAADRSAFEKGVAEPIERWWLTAPRGGDQTVAPFRLENSLSGGGVQVEAMLGLVPEEDGFIEKMPLLPGGTFFSSRTAMEMVLPASVADALKIDPGQLESASVRFRGHDFKVVGVVNDERFRAMKDIDAEPLVPIKSSQKSVSSAGDESDARTSVSYYDTSSMVLIPAGTCRRFGGKPYSVSIRMADGEPMWPVMNRLLTISSAKFYMASRTPFLVGDDGKRTAAEGVYYVGSNYRTSINGLAKLIIPLLIASTIILNTMLGSVFERKSEIAIYNAVGLNPTHIGLFFLAESFVFSVIGSVGGYLIGQVLSICLNKFGLVSDINLNFSSLSVVYVILFTIAVVLLSTLYPAIVATRAAVPSGKRKWSMPAHEGDSMSLAFPFIYEERLLGGIMNYVREYFANFSEASVGDMTAELRGERKGADAKGRPTYELDYLVALAPFDLGVTQSVQLRAAYDEQVGANRITMTITRQSGQDSNWVTTNKPFLEKLRKYLMHWRNLKAADHALHVEQGRQAFA